ncbi:MAG: hypothetical protein WCH79_16205 [Planctomycetia bacterium]
MKHELNATEEHTAALERHFDARAARRDKAEGRFLDRIERKENAARPLIGELCRDGKTVHYVNCIDRLGRFTGKIREGSVVELLSFCIRNRYV